MGDRQRTQQNLEVVRTDAARGLIFVKGSVPGTKNSWMLVRDAVKLTAPEGLPFPGAVLDRNAAPQHEEAPAGLVEAAAEHEVHDQVSPELQEQLAAEQQAGAGDDVTPAVGDATSESGNASDDNKEG